MQSNRYGGGLDARGKSCSTWRLRASQRRSSLRTALDVAQSGEIDLKSVATWSERKGASEKFAEFVRRYHEERHERRQG